MFLFKPLSKITVTVVLTLIIFLVSGIYFVIKDYKLSQDLNSYKNSLDVLSKQVEKLVTSEANNTETIRRLSLTVSSKQNQLTDAVARAAPSVVSIVISKEVPQLEVVYVNPFGDDPFFQGFNIQVPVYKQKGVEKKEVGAGSGFIVGSSGYIITNKHVVYDDKAEYTVLLPKGVQKIATVIYKDPNNDMAIIKIAGSGYPTLQLGDSNTLQAGQTVVAIGNALGQFSNSVSVGVISGLGRTIEAEQSNGAIETLKNVIQTDAAINPGNSGGPLLDLSGNVVGINVATASGSNSIGFSIPINSLKGIIRNYVK